VNYVLNKKIRMILWCCTALLALSAISLLWLTAWLGEKSKATPRELQLLAQAHTEYLQTVSWKKLGSNAQDGTHTLDTSSHLIVRQGLKPKDLTTVESEFLGVGSTVGAQELLTMNMLINHVADFAVIHQRLPRNAAEIALDDPDPEGYIAKHPSLINPATGKLFASFRCKNPSPLGVSIGPPPMRIFGYRSHSFRAGQMWHVVVWRETQPKKLVEAYLENP
jgi:hypothetical protein